MTRWILSYQFQDNTIDTEERSRSCVGFLDFLLFQSVIDTDYRTRLRMRIHVPELK